MFNVVYLIIPLVQLNFLLDPQNVCFHEHPAVGCPRPLNLLCLVYIDVYVSPFKASSLFAYFLFVNLKKITAGLSTLFLRSNVFSFAVHVLNHLLLDWDQILFVLLSICRLGSGIIACLFWKVIMRSLRRYTFPGPTDGFPELWSSCHLHHLVSMALSVHTSGPLKFVVLLRLFPSLSTFNNITLRSKNKTSNSINLPTSQC